MTAFLIAILILLGGAEAAHAELISGIAALVVGGLGSFGSVAVGLLSIGAKYLMSSLLQNKPKDRGVKLEAEKGADKPPKTVLGDWAVPGHLLYHNSYGDDRSRYVSVHILSALPVQGFSNLVEVNGETCEIDFDTTNDLGMHPVKEYVDDGREYLCMRFYDGTQTEADPFLLDVFGDDEQWPWLADMLVKGCAYVVTRCLYSKEGVWSGSPTFLWGVKGIPLYDFRKDSTVAGGSGPHRWNDPSTWTGSGYKNPVIQKYNIIRGIRYNGEVIWGGDAEAWRLPLSYWIAAANAADAEIEKRNGDKIPAFVTGAEIELDDQPIDFIKTLDRCHNGYTTEFGGIYKAFCGAPGLSVMTLTDEDFLITERGEDDSFLTLEETYNSGVATHPIPKEGWVADTTPLYVNAAALADDDDNESMLEAELPLVADGNQAQRVLRSMILDSRAQNKHSGVLPPIAMILEPHDRISYISSLNGYSGDGEDFLIAAKAHLPAVNQQVTLRGINPDAHIWLKEMEMDKTVGLPGRIRTSSLNLGVTVATSWVNSDRGRDKPAILVEWDWATVDVDVARLDWRIRVAGSEEIIAQGNITDLLDGVHKIVHRALRWGKAYQIQFRPEPISARKTSWGGWQSVTLINLDIPGSLTLTKRSVIAKDGTLDYWVVINWNSISGEVDYIVEITDADGDVQTRRTDGSRYKLKVSDSGVISVRVRAVSNDDGTRGQWTSPVSLNITAKNTAPIAPTTLIVEGGYRAIVLTLPESTEKDVGFVDIYSSASNDFTTATRIGRGAPGGTFTHNLGNQVTRYYWCIFVDRVGNASAKFPSSNTAGRSATTSKLTDDDFDTTGPATPTGLALTVRTILAGDGWVDYRIKAQFNAISNSKASYVLRVYDGTEYDNFEVPPDGSTVRKWFTGKPGTTYTVSVAAKTAGGTIGAFSGNVTITPSKKTDLPAAPTGLTATAAHKRAKLVWPKSTDADYQETVVFMSTTGAFADAVEVDRKAGRSTTIDGLTNGVEYSFWIAHVNRSDSTSNKYPTSNTAGVKAIPVRISDADTDPTAPATPSAPAISQITADIDGDGSVDTALRLTLAQPASGVPVKYFEVELQRSGTLGGTYAAFGQRHIVPAEASGNTLYDVKANQAKFYKARYRGISFSGVQGAYSPLTAAGVQPLAYLGSIPTPTLTVTPKAKGMFLKWSKWQSNTYLETIIFRDGVEIARIKGNSFTDNDELTAGTSYSYSVQHMDKQNRVGAASGAVSGTYRAAAASDIGSSAVTDDNADQTPPTTPAAAPAISQITADIDGDGTVDTALRLTLTQPSSGVPVKYFEVELYRSATSGGTYAAFGPRVLVPAAATGDTLYDVKANQAKFYKARYRCISFSGAQGAYSALTAAGVQPLAYLGSIPTPTLTVTPKPKGMFLKWSKWQSNTYLETIVFRDGVEIARIKGNSFTDNDELTAGASYSYSVQHMDKQNRVGPASGGVSAIYKRLQSTDLENDAVLPSKIRRISDRSNLVRDPDCIDLAMFGSSGGTLSSLTLWENTVTESANYLYLDDSSANLSIYTWEQDVAVKQGKTYYASVAFGQRDTALTGNTYSAYVNWYQYNSGTGQTTYISNSLIGSYNGVGQKAFEKVVTAPALARRAQIAVYKNGTDITDLLLFGPIFRKAASEEMTDPTPPATPAAPPAISQITADIDGDGSVDTGLRLTLTQPATGVPVKYFEVELQRSATSGGAYAAFGPRILVPAAPTGDTLYDLKANQAKFHKARYRCISFSGAQGAYSALTAAGVQPLAYLGSIPTPTLTVTPKAKGMFLKWSKWQSNTYLETIVFRDGVEIARIKGNSFTDHDELTAGTGYSYSVQHMDKQNRVGAASGAVSGTYRAVQASDTDQTLPASLTTAPVAVQANVDVDGDGKTDIAVKWTWSKPTDTSNPIVAYQVLIYENGVLIDTFQTAYTTATRKVKTRVNVSGSMVQATYYAIIQTVGFNGKLSSGGTATSNTVSPSKKAAVLAGTFGVSGLTAVQKDYGAYLSWNRSAEPDYLESRIYRYMTAADATADTNGVDLGSFYGNWYQDIDVTIGKSYWYRVRHYDRSGNPGSLSSPVTLIVRGPSRVDNISSSPQNLILDADCADLSQWSVTQSNNDLTRLDNFNNYGAGRYKLRATGASVNIYSALIPVPARGGAYRFSCYVGPEDGVSYDVGVNVKYFYRDSAGAIVEGLNPNFGSGSFSFPDIVQTVSGVTYIANEFQFSGDTGIHFIQVKIRIVTAPAARQINFASPMLIEMTDTPQLVNQAVTTAKLADLSVNNAKIGNGAVDRDKLASGAVAAQVEVVTNGAYGSFNTAQQTIQSANLAHGSGADFVLVMGFFKNVSGATRTFQVTIETSAGTTVSSFTATAADDAIVPIYGILDNPTGTNTTFNLRVTCSTSGNNVSHRRLVAVSYR